jgi:hypothetical protein
MFVYVSQSRGSSALHILEAKAPHSKVSYLFNCYINLGLIQVFLSEPQSPTSPTDPADAVDYPRPGPPGQDHHEDDGAKKEKKHNHGNHEHEKRNKESPQWKVDSTRPTRDILGGRKDFGAGGRIAQPAGKGFAG